MTRFKRPLLYVLFIFFVFLLLRSTGYSATENNSGVSIKDIGGIWYYSMKETVAAQKEKTTVSLLDMESLRNVFFDIDIKKGKLLMKENNETIDSILMEPLKESNGIFVSKISKPWLDYSAIYTFTLLPNGLLKVTSTGDEVPVVLTRKKDVR